MRSFPLVFTGRKPMKHVFMQISTRLISLTLAVLLTVHVPAWSQSQTARFNRISLEHGLSQEMVQSIFQDSQGYIWVGTQNGLNRYDGYQFTSFAHDINNTGSIAGNFVFDIAEDPSGNIWVGLSGDGVSVFEKQTQTFRRYIRNSEVHGSLSHNSVRDILVDDLGNIWLATENGLNRYDRVADQFRYFNFSFQGQTFPLDIRGVHQADSHHLLLATDNLGLIKVPLSELTDGAFTGRILKTPGTQRIHSAVTDVQGRIWAASYDAGLYLFNAAGQLIKHYVDGEAGLSNNQIRKVYQDKDGYVWVATDNGLNKFMPQQNRFITFHNMVTDVYSLSDNNITEIFQDNGGVLWIGTNRGINTWNTATSRFAHYRVSQQADFSLSHNQVNAITQADEQHVWVGTYDGINKINRQSGLVSQLPLFEGEETGVSEDRITALLAGKDGALWAGTRADGLKLLDTVRGKVTHFKHDTGNSNSLSADAVTAIKPGTNGNIWVATFGGGLNLFDTKQQRFYHFKYSPGNPRGLSSNKLLSLTLDSDGLIWAGTWNSGVSILNPLTGSAFTISHNKQRADSLSNDTVWVIHEDSQRNIWIGTNAGLNLLTAENRFEGRFELQRFARQQGLPGDVVYGILEDSIGNIWVSTNRGVSKVERLTHSLSNFDVTDGLQGNEFNAGAFYKATDGRMYFGGSNGLTAFMPADIEQNRFAPPVVLTGFTKLQQHMSIEQALNGQASIQLSHSDYLIAFEFAGLDYGSGKHNQYQYKLEGFDSEWIGASGIRRATYTNLPTGDYVFHVRVANRDGVWSGEAAQVPIHMAPAPWLSPWAYVGYCISFVVLVLVVLMVIRVKSRKLTRYRVKLEQEVRIRTQELQSANERLHNASVTDQLTGLHNRRYLGNIVNQECARISRELSKYQKRYPGTSTGPRLFCLMFDLDGFKPINDTFGHDAGDKIICQISDLLRNLCRSSDTVIRWGGDEFLIMGQIEDIQEVRILGERIRSEIVCTAFDIGLRQKIHLSCSIGYALYPFSTTFPDFVSWEQLQVIADRALYHAKGTGKNTCAGIISTEKQPSVSFMNTLITSLDQVVEQGFVQICETSAHSEPSKGEVPNEFQHAKAS